jgi:hypothetical protein
MGRYIAYDPSGERLEGVKELTDAEVKWLEELGFTFTPFEGPVCE